MEEARTANRRKETQHQQQGAEMAIQMPETGGCRSAVAAEPTTIADKTMRAFTGCGRSWDAGAAVVRTATAAAAALALAMMVTAEQRGSMAVFGLNVPLYSKWSFSDSLEYLVATSAAVIFYSLLQLILIIRKLVKKLPAIPNRTQAWILFSLDQVFACAMLSAGSAAAGVTNLNRTGIRHSALPDFCKALSRFCDRMAISILFSFLIFGCLATSAVIDVVWLSRM
ncbi:hypothetical protein LUZ60_000485 [Juncus effusus]|nr:hypothetical protein LUZ60_000485 [Juncus effusus]